MTKCPDCKRRRERREAILETFKALTFFIFLVGIFVLFLGFMYVYATVIGTWLNDVAPLYEHADECRAHGYDDANIGGDYCYKFTRGCWKSLAGSTVCQDLYCTRSIIDGHIDNTTTEVCV